MQNASAPGAYKFVRVHDADSGAVVLRKAINGGDSVELTVSGGRVRIEFKQPGQKGLPVRASRYLPGRQYA